MARMVLRLTDLLYFAASDAARADVQAQMGAVGADGLHFLEIRFGNLFGFFVRMTYLVAAERALAADLTFSRHVVTLRKWKIIA